MRIYSVVRVSDDEWLTVSFDDDQPAVTLASFKDFREAMSMTDVLNRSFLEGLYISRQLSASDGSPGERKPGPATEADYQETYEKYVECRDLLLRVAEDWQKCAIYGFACANAGAVKDLMQTIQNVKQSVGIV